MVGPLKAVRGCEGCGGEVDELLAGTPELLPAWTAGHLPESLLLEVAGTGPVTGLYAMYVAVVGRGFLRASAGDGCCGKVLKGGHVMGSL